jgi:hypothetical protein
VQVLSYFPGQKVTIYLETVDGYGVRTDTLSLPVVSRIIFPAMTLASGYPQNMTRLDIGLYYFQFTLPSGASSVGSYLVDVSYVNPVNSVNVIQAYQIEVTAPYGNFSVTPIG